MLCCRSPKAENEWLTTFSLLKAGTLEPLQQTPGYTLAYFSLKSLRVQDSGKYSCIYYETLKPHVKSEPSEALEIWVTEALPKPSVSAWPSSRVASGGNVTLLCQSPPPGWNVKFALYKDGEDTPVATSELTQDGAEFPLIHVSINQSGKYRCHYLLGDDSSVSTLPSDSLELIVQGMQNAPSQMPAGGSILITIGRSSIFFLLLVLAFFGYRHMQAGEFGVPRHLVV
ncbi:immunoglobulin superfamily member 1-like [Notamacropus eugenii]|uniref:immunoglobulin superfamily member 1-like n=1 Tax=Notamacropus eugenii TaxID=9315 RepID=UPI003B6749F5